MTANNIQFTKIEIQIAKYLFKHYKDRFNARQLARILNINHAHTNKLCNILAAKQLLTKEGIGNSVYFSFNYKNKLAIKFMEYILKSSSTPRLGKKMKRLKQIQIILASSKDELRKRYKVKELGIFGSYARGKQKKSSDVDILVKFDPNATLFDFIELGNYLEEKLKTKVDIVSEGGIRPELRNNIIKEVVRV